MATQLNVDINPKILKIFRTIQDNNPDLKNPTFTKSLEEAMLEYIIKKSRYSVMFDETS